jgi:hypothetical protein
MLGTSEPRAKAGLTADVLAEPAAEEDAVLVLHRDDVDPRQVVSSSVRAPSGRAGTYSATFPGSSMYLNS